MFLVVLLSPDLVRQVLVFYQYNVASQAAVLLTIGRSYVGNDVTHSTLLDRAGACSYENLPKYPSYRVSNTAPRSWKYAIGIDEELNPAPGAYQQRGGLTTENIRPATFFCRSASRHRVLASKTSPFSTSTTQLWYDPHRGLLAPGSESTTTDWQSSLLF